MKHCSCYMTEKEFNLLQNTAKMLDTLKAFVASVDQENLKLGETAYEMAKEVIAKIEKK